MPLYFFDVADAFAPTPSEAADLESLAQARSHALRYAGQILCDQGPEFWDADEWVLTVSDAQRLALFSLTITTYDAPSIARRS